MEFRKGLIFTCFLVLLIICGCGNKHDNKDKDTYYVEFTNCNDSLLSLLNKEMNGKFSFYKDNRLNILSLNYLTTNQPDMHFYKTMGELPPSVQDGTKKIKVDFSGNLTNDSTYYSIQRYRYENKEWKKVSDLGMIQAITRIPRTKKSDPFNYMDLCRQVIEYAASSTY